MVLLHEPINSLYYLSCIELGFCYLEPTAGHKGLGSEGPEVLILCLWLMYMKTETQTRMSRQD